MVLPTRLLGVVVVSVVLVLVPRAFVPGLGLVPWVREVAGGVAAVVSFSVPSSAAPAGVPGGLLTVRAVLAGLPLSLVMLLRVLLGPLRGLVALARCPLALTSLRGRVVWVLARGLAALDLGDCELALLLLVHEVVPPLVSRGMGGGLMRGWLIRVVLVRSLSLLRWGYVEGIALTWCLPGGSLLPDLRQLRLALLVPLSWSCCRC